jgi:nucleolar GTP-binding protein
MAPFTFNDIHAVPPGKEIIDIVLSKTQRGTPTVIHPGYKIQRIRAFYMRKVKYTNDTISERLQQILDDFPKLDEIHPFYADLCNVLYDKDHYKLALGQLNVAKHLVQNVSRDYVRMLKYGDTLYRCKQLKRAALGRMCTILKKQAPSLSYLEEVRKHLSRLPNIDPNSRTLLITGFPNVGKSSFMNQVTHADVDVQPYAFTTKSLFVGHMDYGHLRWQVIDSPGVLDKPLEERNTIEMQAITALAHLQACVLYFFDVSETCGWNLDEQIHLFQSLRPLFMNKPLVIVCNKVDIVPLAELPKQKLAILEKLAQENNNAPLLPMSAMNAVGITNVKRTACELLLSKRVEQRTKSSSKVNSILSRLTVTQPSERDSITRPPSIPESVLRERQAKQTLSQRAREEFRLQHGEEFQDPLDAEEAEETHVKTTLAREISLARGRTAKDEMWENGGPGIYSVDLRRHYQLFNQEWAGDAIPQIMDGKNIADFVDPDIEAKLEALEREEEQLAQEWNNTMEQDDGDLSDLDEEEEDLVKEITQMKQVLKKESQLRKKTNSTRMPRAMSLKQQSIDDTEKDLEEMGFNVGESSMIRLSSSSSSSLQQRRGQQQKKRKRAASGGGNSNDNDETMMDIVEDNNNNTRGSNSSNNTGNLKKRVRFSHQVANPANDENPNTPKFGLRRREIYPNEATRKKAIAKATRAYAHFKKSAQAGEADRKPGPKLLKHMVVGKRGIGKTDRR